MNTLRKITAATILAFACVVVGCSPKTIYVPTETIRTDTLRIIKHSVDTITSRDSVFVMQNGDTITITKTRYVELIKVRVDTFYNAKVDTITNVVIQEVPAKQLTSIWQYIRNIFATIGIAAVILVIFYIKRKL